MQWLFADGYEGDEEERIIQAGQIIEDSPIYLRELPDFSLQDVENEIKKAIRDYGVKYIFNPKRVLG